MCDIYGVDISLKNVAVVDSFGEVILSTKTGLSLKSTPNDIIRTVYELTEYFNPISEDQIFIDYTSCSFSNRAHQIALFNLFIGAFFAVTWCYSENLHFIAPSDVRKAVGLSVKASKYDVWSAYGIDGRRFGTEHEMDAYVLALYGSKLN